MKPGRAGTMTYDYKRHGTTTLFAALNILDGTVIGRNMQRHRHQEFIRFLNTIEEQVPGENDPRHRRQLCDPQAPKVRQWLARHPRWTFHFTPTSASWLNAVEGFFAKLTRQRLKRGVFRSVIDLQVAINRFVAETNLNPKPFVWTADPKRVIAAVETGEANTKVSPLKERMPLYVIPRLLIIPLVVVRLRRAPLQSPRRRHFVAPRRANKRHRGDLFNDLVGYCKNFRW